MTTLKELSFCKSERNKDHVFTFNSVAEYFQFRNEWKENYKDLSKRIRYAKAHRKTSRSDYDPVAVGKLYGMRIEASKEMERLEAAKEAGRAKKAAKLVAVVA